MLQIDPIFTPYGYRYPFDTALIFIQQQRKTKLVLLTVIPLEKFINYVTRK